MIKEPSANPRHSDARQAASRLFAADFTARFSSNQLTPLRSSIDFNPHADPNNSDTRLFQKTSDTSRPGTGRKLLAMDYIGGGSIGATVPAGYNQYNFPHYPSKG